MKVLMLKNELMDLLENAAMKAKFVIVDLETFCLGTAEMFTLLYEKAVRLFQQFLTTYACKHAFSRLAYLKSKYCNWLNISAAILLFILSTLY